MIKFYLENIFNDLKKSGHTIKKSKTQGVEADTYHAFRKGSKKKGIIRSSKFIKKVHEVDNAFSEIAVMKVIKLINSSGRAFGYDYDIIPIPFESKWEYDKKNRKFITSTSAFTKLKMVKKRYSKSRYDIYSPAQINDNIKKINVQVALGIIGDDDRHDENVISKKKVGYFIDFGHATRANSYVDIGANEFGKFDKQKQKVKEELIKLLHFWQHFASSNSAAIMSVIDDTKKEMGSALRRAGSQADDIIELDSATRGAKEAIKNNLKLLAKETKNYLKEYNKDK